MLEDNYRERIFAVIPWARREIRIYQSNDYGIVRWDASLIKNFTSPFAFYIDFTSYIFTGVSRQHKQLSGPLRGK